MKCKYLNDRIGHAAAWLNLGMLGITFTVVVLRYFFNTGWVWLQESVVYLHAIALMSASAYALRVGAHVRIDLLNRRFSRRTRRLIERMGVILFLWPTCGLILYQAWPYVMASWSVNEGSADAGGLAYVYVLKTFILIYAGLLALEGALKLIDPESERGAHG